MVYSQINTVSQILNLPYCYCYQIPPQPVLRYEVSE